MWLPTRLSYVLKVLARLKYSVHLYKAKSGFSILTEECLTFRTVSPKTHKKEADPKGQLLCL